MLFDCKMQQRERVSLVVVLGFVTEGLHGSDHLILAGVAFAGNEAFDCADWHALVGNAVVFAPGSKLCEEAGHPAT